MPELIALSYSPWSEKARWALEQRAVRYHFRRYEPLIGELELRMKLRRSRGAVTVPVLVTDEGVVLPDSTAIARWADTRGEEGPLLFPPEHEAAIKRFDALSDAVLDGARALTLTRMLASKAALAELAPPPLRAVPGVASKIVGAGIRRTLRKYGCNARSLDEQRRIVTRGLDELREALAGKEPGAPLLGPFTYADITAAQAVMAACPPPFGIKLGDASRVCWTDPQLSASYADLVTWRDALYEKHRPRRKNRAA